jgi:4-hydroxybenzoate polyprenyltransferase
MDMSTPDNSSAASSERPAADDSHATAERDLVRGLLRSLRPHQWVKNLFVLAPLFFSKSYLELEPLALGFAAALLFCLMSGTVYLLNDIFDVDKDRRHPVKRHRPIASGQLPIPVAWVMCGIIGVGTLTSAFLMDWRLGAVLGGYFAMNLAYSSKLKHIAFVDVTIIALGFVLRVLAGAFAIDVYISEWLVACTFLLALYLGLGKRQHELEMVADGRATKVRKVLERYRPDHLDFGVLFVAGLTIATYTIYTLTASLPEQPLRHQDTPFHSPYLPITIPFAVFGITRFYLLIRDDSPHSPTELILRDWPFIVNLVIWGGIMLSLGLFFGPS